MASTSFLEADASSVIKHIAESQTEITHLTPLEISASVSVWHMMQNKNTGGHPTAGIFAYCYADAARLHHAAHSTGRHCRGCCRLRNLGDGALGREEHAGNRSGILKSHA